MTMPRLPREGAVRDELAAERAHLDAAARHRPTRRPAPLPSSGRSVRPRSAPAMSLPSFDAPTSTKSGLCSAISAATRGATTAATGRSPDAGHIDCKHVRAVRRCTRGSPGGALPDQHRLRPLRPLASPASAPASPARASAWSARRRRSRRSPRQRPSDEPPAGQEVDDLGHGSVCRFLHEGRAGALRRLLGSIVFVVAAPVPTPLASTPRSASDHVSTGFERACMIPRSDG